jgi:decaprenylphospho-beta-D-erythro-pentofuranosid-2-ulose 2-reductase
MSKTVILIVGAGSRIAEMTARAFLSQIKGELHFVLQGRNREAIESIAADLSARRSAVTADCVFGEVETAQQVGETLATVFDKHRIDIALIAHGSLPDQVECQAHLSLVERAAVVNGISPALCCEFVAAQFDKQGGGRIGIIGSVAGDRGRKSNYCYGAAKAYLASYVQGLQHRFYRSAVKITLIKPGPTATPMTAHLADASMADPKLVAGDIVRGVLRGAPAVYTPKKWLVIMGIIRALPGFIFNRLNI